MPYIIHGISNQGILIEVNEQRTAHATWEEILEAAKEMATRKGVVRVVIDDKTWGQVRGADLR